MRTIQPKIQEISEKKLSGKKILIEEFSKIWIYLASSTSLQEFRKMLFLSSRKFTEIQKAVSGRMEKHPSPRCLFLITRLGLGHHLDLGHHLQANQTHFNINVFERGLVLTQK